MVSGLMYLATASIYKLPRLFAGRQKSWDTFHVVGFSRACPDVLYGVPLTLRKS